MRQWVAYSGLDPVHQVSGTSVHKPSRISRVKNRHSAARALLCPPWRRCAAIHTCVRFTRRCVERHKTGLQALMAVERKLLHAIYGIFKNGRPYEGKQLFPHLLLESESTVG